MRLRKTWHGLLHWLVHTSARRLSHFVVPEVARLTQEELLSDAFDACLELARKGGAVGSLDPIFHNYHQAPVVG